MPIVSGLTLTRKQSRSCRRFEILFLASLALAGCGEPIPAEPRAFRLGEKVTIAVNDKPAIIVGFHSGGRYGIRYANDLGEIHWEAVREFELEKWNK